MTDFLPDGADPRTLPLARFHPRRAVRRSETPRERSALPSIDVHNHLGRWLSPDDTWMTPDVEALLAVMTRTGVSHIVNLDGRWDDELEENLDRYDRAYPEAFSTFCQLDFSVFEDSGGSYPTGALVRSLRRSAAAGARGLKVWKELGLRWRDMTGELVRPTTLGWLQSSPWRGSWACRC